jgi:hypothetical protein
MGGAIIAGVDAAPVSGSAEHVLDLVPAVVERGVVRDWCPPVSLGRDAGGDPSVGQSGTKLVCVVAPVSEQVLRLWKGIDHERGAFVIAHLEFSPPLVRPICRDTSPF